MSPATTSRVGLPLLAAAWLGCVTRPEARPEAGSTATPAPSAMVEDLPRRPPAALAVERELARLTLEEKVAQLVIAFAPTGDGPIRQGGVILLGKALRDPATLRARVEALQRRARHPLLVAVDLEGGGLNRLKALPTLAAFPSAREMGEEGDWEAEAWGRRAGLDLAALGVNTSLGPVLDLASTGFMAETGRSLGDDPIRVARLARAFARGLSSAGILAIGKHYPGYGPAVGSSDRALLHVDQSPQEIARHQATFVAAGDVLAGVMLANVAFTAYGDVPAILSPELVARAHLSGFLAVTDDLAVPSLLEATGGDAAELWRRAFLAGNDLLLTTAPCEWPGAPDPRAVLVDLVRARPELGPRLDGSVRRVLAAKARVGLGAAPAQAPDTRRRKSASRTLSQPDSLAEEVTSGSPVRPSGRWQRWFDRSSSASSSSRRRSTSGSSRSTSGGPRGRAASLPSSRGWFRAGRPSGRAAWPSPPVGTRWSAAWWRPAAWPGSSSVARSPGSTDSWWPLGWREPISSSSSSPRCRWGWSCSTCRSPGGAPGPSNGPAASARRGSPRSSPGGPAPRPSARCGCCRCSTPRGPSSSTAAPPGGSGSSPPWPRCSSSCSGSGRRWWPPGSPTPAPSPAAHSRTGWRPWPTRPASGPPESTWSRPRAARATPTPAWSGLFRPRVLLDDTLLAHLTLEEVAAVTAHEIGHHRLRHHAQRLGVSLVGTFAVLALTASFLSWAPLYQAFGFAGPSLHAGVALASLSVGTLAFWVTPITAAWSRRQEKAADAYAVRLFGRVGALASALQRLSERNLANPWPHPWYAAWKFSHPPLAERLVAMVRAADAR